jgi:acyl carrier protein
MLPYGNSKAVRPNPAAKACQGRGEAAIGPPKPLEWTAPMSELRDQIFGLIQPFNKKGVELTDATSFAADLEWDSLTVMDFVAEVEDMFDIIISMNMQAEIETVGQLVEAVAKLRG